MIFCMYFQVESQRVIPAAYVKHGQNINRVVVTEPCVKNVPVIPKRREEIAITEAAVQNTVQPAKTLPVLPFITELPSCPDVSFDEILISPLGCLDPILSVYGTAKIPVTELPVPAKSRLPDGSPVSRLKPLFSKISPPNYEASGLDRMSIPPPFI